jgi:hypothetical protein
LLEHTIEVGIRQIGTNEFKDRSRARFGDGGTELHTHRLGRVALPTQNTRAAATASNVPHYV